MKRICIMALLSLLILTGCMDSQELSYDISSSTSMGKIPEESAQFDIRMIPAVLDEYGSLRMDFESTDTATLNWVPINGYTKVDIRNTTDQFSPGIQNAEGNLILDYLYLIHTDGIDIIDYENNIPMRLELFSQIVDSENYKCFISAMANDGIGWVHKNQISEDSSVAYGYLLDCRVRLSENDFLAFHYYFQGDVQYHTYGEIPNEVKEEVLVLIDSFQLV